FAPDRRHSRYAPHRSGQRGRSMDSNSMLRDATIADADALSALVTPLARHLLDADTGASAHTFLATLTPDSFSQRLASPQFVHYVVEGDGQLCGMIAMRDGSHIHHLFVSRNARHQGIARRLWEHALHANGRRDYTVNSSEV